MLRLRTLLLTAVLALVLLPGAGWSAQGTASALDPLEKRARDLEARQYDERISEAEIQDLESEFISLLRQDPGNRSVADRVAQFYDHWHSYLTAVNPALLDLVRTSADPVQWVRTLVGPDGEERSTVYGHIVLAALSARPSDARLWDRAAKVTPDAAWRIAFLEEAFRIRLAASSTPTEISEVPPAAARWLSSLLMNGFLHRALVAYGDLPPAVRAAIDDGSAVADVSSGGFGQDRRDLRLQLAAAAFLDGDRETAGRLLQGAAQAPVAPRSQPDDEPDPLLFLQRLMERALSSPPDDGFDLLTQPLLESPMGGGTLVSSLLVARLAEREAYPALAAHELDGVARSLRYQGERLAFDAEAPARLRTIKEGIDAERESLLQSLEDQARDAEAAASTALGPDPVAPVVARLLSTPVAPVFAERPLPEGIKPVRLNDEQIEKHLQTEARRLHLPPGLQVVRVGQQGERIAAIVTSQGLDPVGEISGGGYWALLSEDRGATWGAPLYTGLRLNQPYVVRPVSALPLFDGDHLRLEVEVRELDPTQIFFPPISLPVKRTAQGLFLDLPLAALARDSDGDGLTDLAEARLLTDPHLADSDGDGEVDGDDMLPAIPQSTDASSATQALAAVVKKIARVGGRALVEGVEGTPDGVACCGRREGPPVIRPTVFFIGERALFAGLRPDRRVVVLTREEADTASEAFGPFFPVSLSLFLFDHSGRRALVIWSASWEGGTLTLEEKDGQWVVKEGWSWIT
ncbi:MAG: thrombospondin type 3 repeat-containing protein [Acidobacteriota bacterium]